MASTSYSTVWPEGSRTSAFSPTALPSRAWPTGLSSLILPLMGSASVRPTMSYSSASSSPVILMETWVPTETLSTLSSLSSMITAFLTICSSSVMRFSTRPWVFLASSYSLFSERSPWLRASLISSASSLRRTVLRYSSSSCIAFRPEADILISCAILDLLLVYWIDAAAKPRTNAIMTVLL